MNPIIWTCIVAGVLANAAVCAWCMRCTIKSLAKAEMNRRLAERATHLVARLSVALCHRERASTVRVTDQHGEIEVHGGPWARRN